MEFHAMVDDRGIVRDVLALGNGNVYRRLDETWIPLHPDSDDEFDVSEWPIIECSEDFVTRFDDADRRHVTLDKLDIV